MKLVFITSNCVAILTEHQPTRNKFIQYYQRYEVRYLVLHFFSLVMSSYYFASSQVLQPEEHVNKAFRCLSVADENWCLTRAFHCLHANWIQYISFGGRRRIVRVGWQKKALIHFCVSLNQLLLLLSIDIGIARCLGLIYWG